MAIIPYRSGTKQINKNKSYNVYYIYIYPNMLIKLNDDQVGSGYTAENKNP